MDQNSEKISTKIIGAAGEHYVVSQILRRGYLAALAPDGAPNSDIIVTDINSQNLCSVQVKTRRSSSKNIGWRMNVKHENMVSEKLFYCFVALGEKFEDAIKTYIIPSEIVAEVVKNDHKFWLLGEPSRGESRKDTVIRTLSSDHSKNLAGTPYQNKYGMGWMDEYLEKWDLIIRP